MNILQIVQRIGPNKLGDLSGADELVSIITNALPTTLHVDVNSTGLDVVKIYEDLPVDDKRKLAALTLADKPALLIDVLNDIYYLESNQYQAKARASGSRNIQIIVFCFLVIMLNTYEVYQYHAKAEQLLGTEYKSSTIEFVEKVIKLIEEAVKTP